MIHAGAVCLGGEGQQRHLPEEHDVGLGPVDGIVDPAARLLDTQGPPLGLQQEREWSFTI